MDKNEWPQPIEVFDTTQFPADKSEELEVLQDENAALKVEINQLKARSTFMIDSVCEALDECKKTVRLWNNQNPIKSHNPLLDADGSGKLLPESGVESKPDALVNAERFIYALNKRTAAERKTIDPVPDGELFTAWEVFQMLKTHHAYVVECALNASLDESASLSSAKTLAEKLVALEAENERLRKTLILANAQIVHHHINDRCGGCSAAREHTEPVIRSAPIPTTGILELAAEAIKDENWKYTDPFDGYQGGGWNPKWIFNSKKLRVLKEALSPEVKTMLEDLSGD